jgi:hypothetical protein
VGKVSARHALTDEEFRVCKIFAGFGFKNAAEAHCRVYAPEWNRKTANDAEKKKLAHTVKYFFEREHIISFLEELKGTGPDAARAVLEDQARLGDTAAIRRQAAEMILDNQDKLGIQDATEKFWEIQAAIGAEVVVPLPGGGEVSAPVRDFFPKFDFPLPPPDVLYKTIQSLDQYLWVALGQRLHQKRHNQMRAWKFGMGMKEFEAGDGTEAAG